MNDPGDEHQERALHSAGGESIDPPALAMGRVMLEVARAKGQLVVAEAAIAQAREDLEKANIRAAAIRRELDALRWQLDRMGGGFDIRGLRGDPRDKPVPQRFNEANQSWEDR